MEIIIKDSILLKQSLSNMLFYQIESLSPQYELGTEDASTSRSTSLTTATNKNSENSLESKNALNLIMNAAQSNAKKSKEGMRYSSTLQLFATYIRMLSGPLVYETLYANLPNCLPSPSTVNRYISKKGPVIIEGVIRHRELKEYLEEKNCPFYVWLSEDATKITD